MAAAWCAAARSREVRGSAPTGPLPAPDPPELYMESMDGQPTEAADVASCWKEDVVELDISN